MSRQRVLRGLARLGVRAQNLAYLLEHPAYRTVRRNGGSRDIFKLLNKPWLPREEIRTVLDVGANTGQFLKTAQALLPTALFYAFEPNPEAAAILRSEFSSPRIKILTKACGTRSETRPLHVARFGPASSLLECTSRQIEEFPETAVEAQVSVQVERLDTLMASETCEPKILLKLDVQGFELEVLEGATGLLDHVAVIVCEANLARLYRGQAELDVLLRFLREREFELVDFAEPIRSRDQGEILYLDIALLRRTARAKV